MLLLPRGRRNAHGDFAATLVLTVILALAGFALLTSVVMTIVEPQPIPGLDLSQRQSAETALYVAAFAVVLPLALLGSHRLSGAIAACPNAAGLPALAWSLAASLAVVLVAVRLSDHVVGDEGMGTLLVGVALWSVAAGASLRRAAADRPWQRLLRFAHRAPRVRVLAAAGVVGTLLTVTSIGSVNPLVILVGAVAIPTVLTLLRRRRVPRLPRRWGAAADVLIVGILLLAVPDLVFIRPEDPAITGLDRYVNGVIQFHHNFLLGPANQVLGGGAMLVDTASQYGVGSIYLLAGWFSVAPIGYGTFALLDGLLTGLFFVAGYVVLRIAGAFRPLAGCALAVAVVALVFNGLYPLGALPQEGPLRFGLPIALILTTVAGARWPDRSRTARGAGLLVIAVASIWAFEAFVFTIATFAAMVCFEAHLIPAGERLRWMVRQGALAGAACVAAHLLLAVATLAAAGQLPDWGQYLAFLDAFFRGHLKDVTYDLSRWSPGLAVGAAYAASAAALVLLALGRSALVRRERVALLAVTGVTAYGIVIFSYFVNRSADHVLPYLSLPALLAGTLWLSLLLRSPQVGHRERFGWLAFALSIALLVVAVAWSSAGPRLERSALAHALPGGLSPGLALDRLWHFPPIDPRALAGERLLNRHMAGEQRVAVLVRPDLDTEILIRSGRANRLALANAVEDGFAPEQRKPGLRDAVAGLEAGDRLLLDTGALEALMTVRVDPESQLLTTLTAGAPTAPLQVFTLSLIDERFRLRTIQRTREGLVVVQLAPRRSLHRSGGGER